MGLLHRAWKWNATRPLFNRFEEYQLRRWGRQNLEMGRCSYYPPKILSFGKSPGKVRVGAFSSVAYDSTFILGGIHNPAWVSVFALRAYFELPGAFDEGAPVSKGDIVIGNDCWIGRNTTLFSGVTVGSGAMVGSNSVVTRDVRPYAIAAGNPAREVRRRFSDEQVEALLEIAWWDWPLEQIVENVMPLNGGSVDDFIETFLPSRRAESADERESDRVA